MRYMNMNHDIIHLIAHGWKAMDCYSSAPLTSYPWLDPIENKYVLYHDAVYIQKERDAEKDKQEEKGKSW
jgi:hypothetical protein